VALLENTPAMMRTRPRPDRLATELGDLEGAVLGVHEGEAEQHENGAPNVTRNALSAFQM